MRSSSTRQCSPRKQPQGRAADRLVDHRRRQAGCDLAAVLQHGLEAVGQRERGPLALAAFGFRSCGGNGDGRQRRQGVGHLLLRAGMTQQLAELAVGQQGLGMFVLGALPLGDGQALREALQGAARLALQGEDPPVFAERVGAVVLQPARSARRGARPSRPGPGAMRRCGPRRAAASRPGSDSAVASQARFGAHVGVHHSCAAGDG